MTFGWDLPSLAPLALGVVAWSVWIALAPPGRGAPLRSGLRLASAALLALALVDAGCRQAGVDGRTLIVLVDRSLSMEVADEAGPSRAEAAAAWLDSEVFAAWSAGWTVRRDSFGGGTTDPAAAVEAAAAELPGAILLISDGRAAGGRSAEPPPVPLFALVPGPAAVADAAVLEVGVEEPTGGTPVARVEVAAVGGRPTAARRLTVAVDERTVGGAEAPPMAPGERRTVSVPLPRAAPGERVVEARLEPADAVSANDRRARIWRASGRPERALLVGLRPGWEMAAWRRALERAHPGPVDARWTGGDGLRPAGGGVAAPWSALDPASYRLAVVVGDPASAGADGAAWLAAFAAAGGRGLAWFPGGHGGRLSGTGLEAPGGAGREGRPALTAAGRSWLAERGAGTAAAPDGTDAWPPLENLPAGGPPAPGGMVAVLGAGGRPVAWLGETAGRRMAVGLGTGWYRWPLAGGDPAVFWDVWSGALVRWLGAADPSRLPLVRLPGEGRLSAGEPLRAEVRGEAAAPVRWRVTGEAGPVAEGTAGPEGIRAGPLPAGAYTLEVEAADGRRDEARFVVESWAADLAWTGADPEALRRAAEPSGGALLGHGPLPPLSAPTARAAVPAAPGRGLGETPWAYLLAAGLVLADWAMAGRRRRA